MDSPQRKIIFNAPGMNQGSPNAASTQPKLAQPVSQPISNPAFRSFAHDIKSNVNDRGLSAAQIVMEEERKRQAMGATREDIEEATEKSGILKIVLIIIGIIAIIGGGVALFLTIRSAAPVAEITPLQDYSLIRAQKLVAIELRDGTKNTLIEAVRGILATRIPEETFVEIRLMEAAATTSVPVGFNRMMEILDSRIPDELLRAAHDQYALGMYGSNTGNIPFLLLTTDSFENAYGGMSKWEEMMLGDIGALFIDQDDLSVIIASSTPSLFQDKVYYNKDSRVVFGENMQSEILWAIVDRRHVVITKDEETLKALIKRLTLENITR